MKLLALAIALAAVITFVRADVDISRDEAAKIKNVDADALEDKAASTEGQIVRVKFNYRGRDISDNQDGSKSGRLSIWRYSSAASKKRYKSGHIDVTFPASALPWFEKISTDDESRQSLSVIVRIGKSDSSPTGEILGREIKTDVKGSHIVW